MATIQDLGKVAYLNKGVYNSETTYEINDVVSFNGSSYVSKTNENRGNLPTNTIYWSIVASKGDKGETGKPFVIEKTYMTIEAMVADYDNMNINDYVMISGNIEEEQNATLWTKTANEVSPYKWEYLADFSGASGITGATPNIIIGNVTEGNQPAVTRRAGSSNENPILDFILKTGPKGDIGDTGNGISSIEKTGTSGLVDTYTITYTDGTTSTFQVTNGEDADITPEEFEDLQNEVDELKDENARLKATLPTTKETGENITLDKTAELDFVVPPLPIGNTKQNTNLSDGILEQGSLTEGSPASANDRIRTANYIEVKEGTEIPVNATSTKTIQVLYAFYNSSKTFISNSGWNNIGTNVTIINNVKYIKIVIKNSDGTNISPNDVSNFIVGNIPNPEYEQEVQVVKGDVEVKVENGNLVNEDNLEVFNNNRYVKFNDNYYINVEPNTAYTLSIEVFAGDGKFVEYDENNNTLKEISIYSILTNGYVTITTTANTKKIKFYAQMYNSVPSETPTKYTAKCMFKKGSTASPYTPHQEQKLPLTLGNIELCKIGDYKDLPVKNLSNGKWYWKQMVMKKTITSNSITQVDVAYSNIKYFRFLKSNNDMSYNNYSEQQFYYSNAKYTNNGGSWDNSNLISKIANRADATVYWIGFPIGTTLEEAKEALNNSTLYYQLKEPIFTEITDTTLISQLEAIYNAISYYEQTNISGTSSGISPLFDVEAYQNTKLLLEDIINSN